MPKDLGRKIKFADLADNEGTLKVAKMFQEACDAVPTTSAGPSASLVNTSDIHEKFEFRLAPRAPRFCFRQAGFFKIVRLVHIKRISAETRTLYVLIPMEADRIPRVRILISVHS